MDQKQLIASAYVCECPACGEGDVSAVLLGEQVRGSLCAECEALWMEGDVISAESFWQLGRYLQSRVNDSISLKIHYICRNSAGYEQWVLW